MSESSIAIATTSRQYSRHSLQVHKIFQCHQAAVIFMAVNIWHLFLKIETFQSIYNAGSQVSREVKKKYPLHETPHL